MILFIMCLIIYFLYDFSKVKTALQMLQQNFYNESNRYLKWTLRNIDKAYITFDLLALILIFIPLFIKDTNICYTIFLIVYGIIYIIDRINKKTEQVKKPLVVTFRIKRLAFTVALFYVLVLILYFTILNKSTFALFTILVLMNVLAYITVYLSYLINLPIEQLTYNYYKNKAAKKISSFNTISIGVTGSYGKTSSKNILYDILSKKYIVYASPGNFNTPLGLMRTINQYLDKFDEIFIPEISASRVHDIKRSCDFIKPKYGIITNIGLAHLDTFKTEENIQKTKFELIESLPNDGLGVLNIDDPKQGSYKLKNNCRIKWIGIDSQEGDCYAFNIKYTNKGTSFDCKFKDDGKIINFKTKLFGKPNIYNILAGLMIAKDLGLTYEQMQNGVASIKPIEHRLELKKYKNVTIIDDAYNSNPVGSKMALDVLSLMPGMKIVVTPGMIELKDKEYELNKKFGEYISECADYVVLVGKKQTKPIQDGLSENNYPKEKIFIINDVKEAFPLIDKLKDNDTYVLLENDLPDLFNEK